MTMDKTIKEFSQQFVFEPEVVNEEALVPLTRAIIAGMGGSHLAGDIIRMVYPSLPIFIHSDYGLPRWIDAELKRTPFIAISYSGNTEETLDALDAAMKKGMSTMAITTGGALFQKAKEARMPYVLIPHTGIQPRMATGFILRALMKFAGKDDALKETRILADSLDVNTAEKKGEAIAKTLKGKIPIIYASRHNEAIAYNWKIKFNETGKIPAFYNIFPELNHNEMNGFSVSGGDAKSVSGNFHFIFLRGTDDHPRIQKRMDVCEKIYAKRGFGVENIALEGKNIWEKIFQSLLIADWAAFFTATMHGQEPNEVLLIEEFKKML